MASTKKCLAAAAEVVQAPVSDTVLLTRAREGTGGFYLAAGAVFAAVVVLASEMGVVSALIVYAVGFVPVAVLLQLALIPVFAVRIPGGIQMTSGSRWNPKPVPPVLGPLDPAGVAGPLGLMRNIFEIQGVRHRVPVWQRGRFERMLAAAASAAHG